MKLSVYPTAIETSRALILHLLEMMSREPTRVFHVALSGGNTPGLMFDLWASEYADVTAWNRLRLYWVDERCVGPDDPDSNYGMTRNLLLSAVSIPYENIFRIRGEAKPEKEAERYSDLVIRQLPLHDGFPQFDIILLGAGDDGHTSSIFPGQEELLTAPSIYSVSSQPATGQLRIALTGIPICHAHSVIFLITGKSKAPVVAGICRSADAGPAAYIAHHARHVELFIDKAAASAVENGK